ncbi:MAG: hypothetical protein WDM90_05435 [Ferruginibacter sp.]
MKVLVVDSSVLIIERLQNMLSETGTIEMFTGQYLTKMRQNYLIK